MAAVTMRALEHLCDFPMLMWHLIPLIIVVLIWRLKYTKKSRYLDRKVSLVDDNWRKLTRAS